MDGADAVRPFSKGISLLQTFQKAHNGNAATFTYTLPNNIGALLIEYVVVLGDAASNLPSVSVNGVYKAGFALRTIHAGVGMSTFAYYLVLKNLKKGDTLVMASPYWGTNAYDLQLWGC